MNRRKFLTALGGAAAWPLAARAQQPAMPVIGFLHTQSPDVFAESLRGFRRGLKEAGFVEGETVTIEYRWAENHNDRLPVLAAELVRLPVDLIVAQGAAAFEIRGLGLPVPVVFSMSADPVSAGFADSLARPRGNMTGVTLMAIEFNGKRLELLQEIVPELRRVAILGNPEHPGSQLERAFSEETAQRLGLTIEYRPTRTRDELLSMLNTISARPPQAISLLADGFAIQNRQTIIDFAMRHRVPVISGWPIFARSGAICT
jgi:putative tryptophan/tyrosine transport system substrate-binding protein